MINEIVGNSVIYYRTRVPRNVTISYNGLAMGRLKAMVNEALFEWVIENLIKNAMDALSGRGTIDVKLSADNDWIYIDVKDTGKGMPKSNFKRIFEPGFTTKTRGWGLGLSLSKRTYLCPQLGNRSGHDDPNHAAQTLLLIYGNDEIFCDGLRLLFG